MLLTIQNIQKYFGAELCLRNISCVLDAQDRAGIIGENGAGKTTLIKIITGELYPDDGIVTLAHGATVGYLEQNSVLDPACTVYGEMENAFRSVLDAMDEMKRLERQMAECPGDHMLLERHAQLSAVVDAADGYNMDTQIKKILNGMAFPAPDYQKSVAVLSGGEHTRLCLAKLLLQKPDLLILDEPTNHMDIVGKEALEQMLKSYTGTVLFVSHDRYFIKEIATGILDFQADKVQYYPCTYEEYLEQKQKEAQGLIGGNKTNAAGNSGKSRNVAGEAADNRNISQVGSQSNPPTLSDVFDKKTYYNPGKIISRLKQQLVKYEKMLGESEERLAELQMQQMDTALATDYEKLTELEQAIAAEQSNQESILDRLVETETELDEMQEKTV